MIIKQTRVMEPETIKKNVESSKNHKSKRNLKLFTLLTFILLFGIKAMAQDFIILKNGDEIKSLVQEVGAEYVKYKKFDNQTGPVYNMAVSEIFMIQYANGSKDVFNKITQSQETKTEQEEVKQEPQKPQKPANLAFVSGKVFLDDKALTHEQVRNLLTLNDSLTNTNAAYYYMSGYSQLQLAKSSRASMWMSLGLGVGCLIASSATWDGTYGANNDTSSFFDSMAIVCFISSITSSISWLIFDNSGNNRINDAMSTYNTSLKSKHSSDVSMNFGITRSGDMSIYVL